MENLYETVVASFPELNLISNQSYRDAVIKIWVEVWKESEWDDIHSVPKSLDVLEYSNVQHVRSVTQQASACADIIEKIHKIKVDRDILITGALLHDVSKFLEYGENGKKTIHGKLMQHAIYGVHKAIEHQLPIEIQHLIVSHTGLSRVMPQTIESLILHYVDFLDSDVLLHVLNKPLFLKK